MALGKKIRIYYDPRGQAIKTVNPDDSFQTVFFGNVTDLAHPENYEPSPWVSFTYDANDNANRRTSGPGLTPTSNFDTPKSAEVDALGRTIKTTEHKVQYEIISDPGVTPVVWGYTDVVMQYQYDLRGNLLKVTDPIGRTAFEHKYDYANRGLWTEHIDSGASTVNMDVMGKPIEATDTKGAKTLSSYDVLNRPIRLWALDKAGASFSMRQYMIYGDDLTATGYTSTQTKTKNLYGKGWKAFDEAGMVRTEDYDFKGNLIEKTRQVISDSELLSVFPTSAPWNISPYIVDWTGLPASTLLDSQQFVTTMEYDALNRAMKVTYPEDVNAVRKELIPTYNRAGTLTSVEFDGTEYVKEIAYNAKGQPLLTAYGNGIMTRYVYDDNTFRPLRMRSEPYSYTNTANNPTYTYTGGVKQDIAYEYDLIGNIMKLHDRATDSGLTSNPDELDRLFNYDPLYRVISATGRESTNQSANILWGDAPAAGSPNASHCRAYTQTYKYDKLGNMLELGHVASSNTYTRRYVYGNYANNNQLTRIDNGGSTPIVYSDFGYDVNGNMTSSDTSRGYVWDAADQLRAFYIQAGASEPSVYAQYLYSGGQRVKKIVRTTGGDYEVTVYDGAFQYCKKVSGSTTYEKNYSQVEGGVEIRTLPTGVTTYPGDITDNIVYQLPDNLGGVNIRLDTSGTLIDKEEHYPFGDTSLRTFTYKRYRYVGKEKDSESGLYYYGARYYASWTCRFISVDPLAASYADLTPYNYAGNRPINYVDINGEQSEGNQETPTNGTGNTPSGTGGTSANNNIQIVPLILPKVEPRYQGDPGYDNDTPDQILKNDAGYKNGQAKANNVPLTYSAKKEKTKQIAKQKQQASEPEREKLESLTLVAKMPDFLIQQSENSQLSDKTKQNNGTIRQSEPNSWEKLKNDGILGSIFYSTVNSAWLMGQNFAGSGYKTNLDRSLATQKERQDATIFSLLSFVPIGRGVSLWDDAARGATTSAADDAARVGLTDLELVTKAAQKAEKAIGGKGGVAGTAKHTYANDLLDRYQTMFGNRGFEFNYYFNNNASAGLGNRGFLDVINRQTMTIYDFKFGNAFMSKSQFLKYSSNFPGYSIQIIKP